MVRPRHTASPQHTFDDPEAAWEMIRAGFGVGYGPTWMGIKDGTMERSWEPYANGEAPKCRYTSFGSTVEWAPSACTSIFMQKAAEYTSGRVTFSITSWTPTVPSTVIEQVGIGGDGRDAAYDTGGALNPTWGLFYLSMAPFHLGYRQTLDGSTRPEGWSSLNPSSTRAIST